jgi:class 3 adenylate cyclase
VIQVNEPSMSGEAAAAHGDAAGEALRFSLAPDAVRPPLQAIAPGAARVGVQNETGVPALVALEMPDWPQTAATAALVGTLQEFRDLFASEVLAPGLQVAIQRLAFLFTDLAGSTALYQAVGQARAYRLVQDHFRILGSAIAGHRGALVKTIGDAVMATFPTSADAVAAALAMQREMGRLDTGGLQGAVDTARLLKVGVHEGPCIAVGANERLDYFGTTINVAARIQHEGRGGEIVLSADVYAAPGVADLVRDAGLTVEQSETHLRGVREPVRLYRVTGAAAPPAATRAVTPAAAMPAATAAMSGYGSDA